MKLLSVMALLGLSFEAFCAMNVTYFAPLDVKAIHDKELQNEKKGEAPSYAVPHKVSLSPSWEKSGSGYVWEHQVSAPNAVSLNFGFSRFHLPEGAELNIFSADRSQFIRTFTSHDNNVSKELWTPVIMSDDVIIELKVSEDALSEVE